MKSKSHRVPELDQRWRAMCAAITEATKPFTVPMDHFPVSPVYAHYLIGAEEALDRAVKDAPTGSIARFLVLYDELVIEVVEK